MTFLYIYSKFCLSFKGLKAKSVHKKTKTTKCFAYTTSKTKTACYVNNNAYL